MMKDSVEEVARSRIEDPMYIISGTLFKGYCAHIAQESCWQAGAVQLPQSPVTP